jgi:hypothetical protein
MSAPKWAGDIFKHVIGGLVLMAILAAPGYLVWLEDLPLFLIPLSILFAAGLILFGLNQLKLWKKGRGISKYSDKKIEKIIREWIDIPNVTIERKPPEAQIHFYYVLTYKNILKVNIVRDTQNPAIIQLAARVQTSLKDVPLKGADLRKNTGRIGIEMARLGIDYQFDGSPNPLDFILLVDPLILDDSLTEFHFRQRVLFVLRAMVLVIETSKRTVEELGLTPPNL